MSKLYEAEIKLVSPQPITQEDIKRGLETSETINLVHSTIQDMGNSPYQDEYFFSEDNKNHVRFRYRESGVSEITSKRFLANDKKLIRVEPEVDIWIRNDQDIKTLYCLMHNMGFSHRLSIKKTNIVMMDGYFVSSKNETIPIQISSYTACATYPKCTTDISYSKHFFEVEIDKNFLDQPENASYLEAGKLLNVVTELMNKLFYVFPNLAVSSQLLPSHFMDYKAQCF